jgi:hypothetical protein
MAVGGIVKHQNFCHVYFLHLRGWNELSDGSMRTVIASAAKQSRRPACRSGLRLPRRPAGSSQ